MADIRMCAETACPDSKRCRRHADSGTYVDPYYQSYWMREDNAPVGERDCDGFWEVRRYD